jgi:hypothetical protein
MSAVAFLRYELRRHLPTLALWLLTLALVPFGRRLATNEWRYWDGAWNVWGAALTLYIFTPLLTMAMASSGWARERSLGLYEWLYARPLSNRMLFTTRALTVAGAALLWSALAMLVHRVGRDELELALSIVPGLPGPTTLFIAGLALALGAGLLSSALAASTETALRASFLATASVWLLALLVARLVTTSEVLIAASRTGQSHFLDRAVAGFVFAVAAVLMIAAWRCVSRAPDRDARARLAISTAAAGAAIAALGLAATLHLPLAAGGESPYAVWLEGDRSLTFAPALGMGGGQSEPHFTHPILHAGGERRVVRSLFTFGIGVWDFSGASPSRSGGAAVMEHHEGWVLFESDGTTRVIELPPQGTPSAIGWSRTGRRFAWAWTPGRTGMPRPLRGRSGPASRLFLLEADRSLRSLPILDGVDTGPRSAAWVDDRMLLVPSARAGDAGAVEIGWSLVDVEGSVARVTGLPAGTSLDAPALRPWGLDQSALPRLDGEPIVVQVEGETASPVLRLGRLEVEAGAIEPLLELEREASALSLGNLDDGSLVWAAGERPIAPPSWDGGRSARIFQLAALDGEPRLLCTLPHGRIGRYRGQSGAWAIWESIWFPDYRLWGCNLETGQVRELVEWRPWAHGLATITTQGLWTSTGWRPLER